MAVVLPHELHEGPVDAQQREHFEVLRESGSVRTWRVNEQMNECAVFVRECRPGGDGGANERTNAVGFANIHSGVRESGAGSKHSAVHAVPGGPAG